MVFDRLKSSVWWMIIQIGLICYGYKAMIESIEGIIGIRRNLWSSSNSKVEILYSMLLQTLLVLFNCYLFQFEYEDSNITFYSSNFTLIHQNFNYVFFFFFLRFWLKFTMLPVLCFRVLFLDKMNLVNPINYSKVLYCNRVITNRKNKSDKSLPFDFNFF